MLNNSNCNGKDIKQSFSLVAKTGGHGIVGGYCFCLISINSTCVFATYHQHISIIG